MDRMDILMKTLKKTKNGVVEDEGKEVMGKMKMTNEDSVKLTEDKKGG
jgi:hypothetical protein